MLVKPYLDLSLGGKIRACSRSSFRLPFGLKAMHVNIFGTQALGAIPSIHRVTDAVVKSTGPGTPHNADTATLRLSYSKGIHKLNEIRKNISCIRSVRFLTVFEQQCDSASRSFRFQGSQKLSGCLIGPPGVLLKLSMAFSARSILRF